MPDRVLLVRHGRTLLALGVATLIAITAGVLAGPPPRAAAAVSPGVTSRVSLGSNDAQSPSGGDSPVISSNGRHVAFVSSANLDKLNPSLDRTVFVRDTATGHTVQISRGQFRREGQPARTIPGEVPPDGASLHPAISADGRYVAFSSNARNIVDGTGGRADIFICDRNPSGDGRLDKRLPDGSMDYRYIVVSRVDQFEYRAARPSLSADGRQVAWQRSVYDPYGSGVSVWVTTVDKETNGALKQPSTPDHFRKVDAPLPSATQYQLSDPRLSANGRHLVVTGTYTSADFDGVRFTAIVGVDLGSGAVTRLDVDDKLATIGTPTNDVSEPAVSADGGAVAFTVRATVGDPVVRLVERAGDGKPTRSSLVSRDTSGAPASGMQPALSSDAQYIAFVTDSYNVHNGVNGPAQSASCIREAPIVIASPPASPPSFPPSFPPSSPTPSPTPAPIQPAFMHCNVVVRDLVLDRQRANAGLPLLPAELASPSLRQYCGKALPRSATCAANGESTQPSLTGSGDAVAYASSADDLVANDTNKAADAFVRRFAPELQVDPVDFGQQTIGGSATRSTAVRHRGFGPVTIDTLAVGGPNAADFPLGADTCTGQVLHATGSCLVSVRFTPSAANDRKAELQVRPRGPALASTGALRGTGVAAPPPPVAGSAEFHAAPDPVRFGERLTLSANTATVTVTNGGSGPLRVGAVAIPHLSSPAAPDDYAVVSDNCANATLAPGASCQVTVTFTPHDVGERTAVLRFDDNAPGGPHLVGLRGTATRPSIEVNPTIGPPRRVTTVIGRGFPSSHPVTVRFAGFPESAATTTDALGTFSVQLLVFPNGEPGNRTVQAVADGAVPQIGATTAYLVVPGTLNPPDFAVRH